MPSLKREQRNDRRSPASVERQNRCDRTVSGVMACASGLDVGQWNFELVSVEIMRPVAKCEKSNERRRDQLFNENEFEVALRHAIMY